MRLWYSIEITLVMEYNLNYKTDVLDKYNNCMRYEYNVGTDYDL